MPKINNRFKVPILPTVLLALGLIFGLATLFLNIPEYLDSICTKVSYPSSYEFNIFDSVLKKYVKYGLLDYRKVKNDPLLNSAYEELKHTSPKQLKGKLEQLSYWVNTFNLLTIKCICDHYPVKTLGQSAGTQKFIVGGKLYSLNEIKEEVLPELIETSDWRAIFLFCSGSLSSPFILDHAYSPSSISDEFDPALKRFVQNKSNYFIDEKNKTFSISKFYKWNSRYIDSKYPTPFAMVNEFLPAKKQVDLSAVYTNYAVQFDYQINDLALLEQVHTQQKESQ